jgi:hypothetical protein
MSTFDEKHPPRVVTFSGGRGASLITRKKGGRVGLAKELERYFPTTRFLSASGNNSVELVLIPDNVDNVSPTKLKQLKDGTQVMKISNFLRVMNRPDLISTLEIIPSTKSPAIRRHTSSSPHRPSSYSPFISGGLPTGLPSLPKRSSSPRSVKKEEVEITPNYYDAEMFRHDNHHKGHRQRSPSPSKQRKPPMTIRGDDELIFFQDPRSPRRQLVFDGTPLVSRLPKSTLTKIYSPKSRPRGRLDFY